MCVIRERKKEGKKDVLSSSKTKFGPWAIGYNKWNVYPIIEKNNKINIDKRDLVLYKKAGMV